MNIDLPEIHELTRQIELLKKEIAELKAKVLPAKMWFSLKEACALKGLHYKTACNKPSLQPNKGKMDGKIGGRKWLEMMDGDL